MDYDRARQVLGTAENASRADIERAFRTLAGSAHPDRGGHHERMSELLEARDTLLRGTTESASTALVNVDTIQSLAMILQKASRNADALTVEMVEIKNKIQFKSVNRLKQFRLAAAIAAAVLTASTFMGKEAPKEIFSHEEDIKREQTRLALLTEAQAAFEKAYAEAEKEYSSSLAVATKDLQNAEHALATNKKKSTQQVETLTENLKAAQTNLADIEKRWNSRKFTISKNLNDSFDENHGMPFNFELRADNPDAAVEKVRFFSKGMVRVMRSNIDDLEESQASATRIWQSASFSLACICGLLSGLFTLRIRRIELTFDDLNDQLSSKTMAHRIIRDAFGASVPSQWSIIDLAEGVDRYAKDKRCPYRHLVSVVGPLSLAQYIAGRAKQAELLDVFEEMREGEFLELYSVRCKSPE
ncbi:hypothetical protein CBA19CS22_00770 [Caballeronia novacaledonica]|uniref:Uncharacterized protein n=1 Tax=Caballeronia novacaledonica TaxID=1544861 RepID=A0ACB5QJ21_9BURK|nr:hypothetical protein CBA19CS22_00770 [Caballeronia novacaledonica]